MTLEKKPFVNYTLEEDKKNPFQTGKIVTVRLNPQEYQALKEDMKIFRIKNESTGLKLLVEIGRNVTHGLLGRTILKRLADPYRVKPDD